MTISIIKKYFTVLVCIIITGCGGGKKTYNQIYVSAASSLYDVLTEIADIYSKKTGEKVVLTFHSTGQIAEQVRHGAPIDLFCAADMLRVNNLSKNGFIYKDTVKPYAAGELVLYSKYGKKDVSGQDLTPEYKVGIANPDHAPYGVAAKEVLVNKGLWENIYTNIIFCENVRQVYTYAVRGEIDAGFIPRSFVNGSDTKWTGINSKLYTPIIHGMGVPVSADNPQGGRKFSDFILSTTGQAVFRKYGFPYRQSNNE